MSTLRSLVERTLWVLLFGLDRFSAGVEEFRHLRRHGTRSPSVPADWTAPQALDPGFQASAPRDAHISPAGFSSIETKTEPPLQGKEEPLVSIDQDLSGDMVKVVQYTIVSVATDIMDDARVIWGPKTVAFGDNMTAADFSVWRLAVDGPEIHRWIDWICNRKNPEVDPYKDLEKMAEVFPSVRIPPPIDYRRHRDILKNPKWYRVAFHVMGRFAPVDIDWAESQARSLRMLAEHLKPPVPVKLASPGQDFNLTIGPQEGKKGKKIEKHIHTKETPPRNRKDS